MFSKFDGNELVRQRQSYCGAIDLVHGIAKNSIVIAVQAEILWVIKDYYRIKRTNLNGECNEFYARYYR